MVTQLAPADAGHAVPGVIWPKDRAVVTDDGARIGYTFLGPRDGPVVALCAGLLCPDTWWHHLAPALAAEGHRVLVFHYRGIAVSGRPAEEGPDSYSILRCAKDLLAIVEAEDIRRLSILGHSMGVQVALEAYRLMAVRTQSLVTITGPFASPIRSLYDRGPLMTYGLYHPLRALLRSMAPPLRRRVWRAVWRGPALELGKLVGAFGPRIDAQIVRSYIEHAASMDPDTVLKIFAGMHEHTARANLRDIAVPTLIIAGGVDPFTPPSQARIMAERVPDATLRVVPHGTHGAILEYPEIVNGWVLDFLEREVRQA